MIVGMSFIYKRSLRNFFKMLHHGIENTTNNYIIESPELDITYSLKDRYLNTKASLIFIPFSEKITRGN